MSDYVIYHNPRCSKSRAALKLLEERGVTPEVRLYLDDPPDARELRKVLQLLGLGARDILRDGEEEFAELNLADNSLGEARLIETMARHPRLIQRPIVIRDNRAARIGRPPEAVLELLSDD